jgi:hypothetical protein
MFSQLRKHGASEFKVLLRKDSINRRRNAALDGAIGRITRFPFVSSLSRPHHETF